MNRPRTSLSTTALAVAAGVATACTTSGATPSPEATQHAPPRSDAHVPTASLAAEEDTVHADGHIRHSPSPPAAHDPTTPLPADELARLVDGLPTDIGVPGVVVGVSTGSSSWIGAAGIDDTHDATPMEQDRQFRAASITKVFTATTIMGMVEDGQLSLDDTLDGWFPAFPNADGITIRMLLGHTGGVTGDWWHDPDIAQLALDDLGRTWTPKEVLDVMANRAPAGPPDSPTVYSNTGYILLGQIAAEIGGAPIGELIHDRILRPLDLNDTSYQYEPAPRLAHAHYELDGSPIDMSSIPMQALPSMAGAAGAIQTTASDLMSFISALLGSDSLLDAGTTATMASGADPESRFQLGLMGFCPCDDGYGGWGHTGDLPGHFSAVAHFPDLETSVVVFLNSDVVNGETFGHDQLDPVVDALVDLATTPT